MTQKIVVFQNKYGLHTAAATLFVYQANQYQSSVWLVDGNRKVNAKSLLGVLSLGIYQGSEATLVANGSDEEKAVKELCELIRTGLDEADHFSFAQRTKKNPIGKSVFPCFQHSLRTKTNASLL